MTRTDALALAFYGATGLMLAVGIIGCVVSAMVTQ